MARFWGFPSSLGTMARMKYRLAKHARARSRGGASALNREKFLRIGCLNADGWNEQTEYDVTMAIEAKNLDIFTVVETHSMKGDSGRNKKKINVPGFKVFEAERDRGNQDKRGGGIAVLVREAP